MAVVLNLFGDAAWEALKASPASQGHSESSLRSEAVSPSVKHSVGCCIGCPYDGMCDSSECAMLFPCSGERMASTRFPNLGVFIEFKKRQGWL